MGASASPIVSLLLLRLLRQRVRPGFHGWIAPGFARPDETDDPSWNARNARDDLEDRAPPVLAALHQEDPNQLAHRCRHKNRDEPNAEPVTGEDAAYSASTSSRASSRRSAGTSFVAVAHTSSRSTSS